MVHLTDSLRYNKFQLNPLNPEGAVQIMTMLIEVPPGSGKPIKVTYANIFGKVTTC